MKIGRDLILGIAAISSIVFIAEYVRVVTALFPNADPTHLVLFAEPQITAYRPWTHAGVHGGYRVSLFNAYGLTPDGTVPVFRFPDWPFLILAIGVLVYAVIRISRRRRNRSPNETFQATAVSAGGLA
jgi:hypothetical protein